MQIPKPPDHPDVRPYHTPRTDHTENIKRMREMWRLIQAGECTESREESYRNLHLQRRWGPLK